MREPGRRAGVGAALVEAALERARARGCARVQLDVFERNGAALALYEQLGFTARREPAEGLNLLMERRL